MSGTYKMVTLIGTSPDSYEQAIQNALQHATTTLRHLTWFEVQELRGGIADGRVKEYQVKLQVGLKVEGP